MSAANPYDQGLAKLGHALPRITPWFKPAMDAQFGLSVAATVFSVIPLAITAVRRRRKFWTVMVPFTVAHEGGVRGVPLIVPIPITICMLMVFVMSVGSLVSGRLVYSFFSDPLGQSGEGGLACLFVVWFLAAVGMALACFGCAVSAILSPASRSSYRTFVRTNPVIVNLLCLGFPFCYGIAGLVVSSIVQYRLDQVRSSGRALQQILLAGRAGTDPMALFKAQAATPAVEQALQSFESLNRRATWMNASMTCLMILICTPCLIHIFLLSRSAMRTTCTRLDGQIHRLSMATTLISKPPSLPVSPTSLSFASNPTLSIAPAQPKQQVQVLAAEKRRIRWRHITVLAQWMIALICLLHLGVMALYLAINYKSIAESNWIVIYSLVSASVFSPAYNLLMSLMTIIRMLFLEDQDKTLLTGSRSHVSVNDTPAKFSQDKSSTEIQKTFVPVAPFQLGLKRDDETLASRDDLFEMIPSLRAGEQASPSLVGGAV